MIPDESRYGVFVEDSMINDDNMAGGFEVAGLEETEILSCYHSIPRTLNKLICTMRLHDAR